MSFITGTNQNQRTENQDSSLCMSLRVNHEAEIAAYTVADGMGGLSGGKYFSSTAVRLFFEKLTRMAMEQDFLGAPLEDQLRRIGEFSAEVYGQINRELYRSGMDRGFRGGTTLSAAIHFWDTWFFSNCGDSPIYVLTDNQLELVSTVHNQAEVMVDEGRTSKGSALYYQNRNRLLEYLGRREDVVPALSVWKDCQIQQVLMGSDGAFGVCSRKEICELLLLQCSGRQVLDHLFEKSRDRGEDDNQTAVLIYEDEPDTGGMSECVEEKVTEYETDREIYRPLERDRRIRGFASILARKRGKRS